MTVGEIAAAIAAFAPPELAAEYDNCGLIVGDEAASVTRAVVCVDVTPAAVAFAAQRDAQLIVSHHPPIFRGVKRLTGGFTAEMIAAAITHKVALIAAHTNLDACEGGLNDALCRALGGTVTAGVGECRRTGEFSDPVDGAEFSARLEAFGVKVSRTVSGIGKIARYGVATGSGTDDELFERWREEGVDAIVTAEVKHHIALAAKHYGMWVFEPTHYGSERHAADILGRLLERAGIPYEIYGASPYDAD